MNVIEYKIGPNFLSVNFQGVINIDGILKLMNDINIEMKSKEELRIVVDSRNAHHKTRPSDIPPIVGKLIEYGNF